MTPTIAKIILYVTLAIELITFLVLYRLKKDNRYSPYYYVLSTIIILCLLISLSLDSGLFKTDHDSNYYLIEFGIYQSAVILGYLLTLLVRIIIKKRKSAQEL